MRKLLTFLIALGAIVFAVVSPVSAQGFNGGGFNIGLGPFASYQGPGDVSVNGTVGGSQWWGFWSSARCWNNAYAVAHGAAMDLEDQSAANPITINCLSTGFVDVATLNAWVTAHSVTTIQVTNLHDQTGSGHDLNTGTNLPTLTVSGLNSLPVMNFTASPATALRTSSVTLSFSQPVTMGGVANRTTGGVSSTPDAVVGTSNPGSILGFQSGTANKAAIYAGSNNFGVTAADGSWHGLNALMSGVSSALNVDGTDNLSSPTNIGATGLSSSAINIGDANAVHLIGKVAEIFIVTATSSATDRNNLFANMNGTNGYNGAL